MSQNLHNYSLEEKRGLCPYLPNSLANKHAIASWSGETKLLFDNAADPYLPQKYEEVLQLLSPPKPAQNFRLETVQDTPCVQSHSFYFGRGEAVLRNALKYTGDMEFSTMHGQGTLAGPSFTYSGSFRHNEIEGAGKYRWSGCEYQGQVKRGLRHGRGTMRFDNGTVYAGEWFQGLRHGQGLLTLSSGQSYEGGWDRGQKHGFGVLKYASGARYEGEFKGDLLNGRGTFHWERQRYTGDWLNGKMHGRGTHVWLESGQLLKNRYEGEWQGGLRHGFGVFYYSNGSKYEGQWESGLKHGQGTMIFEDGTEYTGEFAKDKVADKSAVQRRSGLLSERLDLGDLTEGDLKVAEKEVQKVLLKHYSLLKQRYSAYCSTVDDEVIMVSRTFWELLWDCRVVSYRCSLASINRLLVRSQDVHAGSRPMLFRQFLEALVRVAFLKYANGGQLRGRVKRDRQALVDSCRSQLGIALATLVQKKLVPHAGRRGEYRPAGNPAARGHFNSLARKAGAMGGRKDETVELRKVLGFLGQRDVTPRLISVEEVIEIMEEHHDPEAAYSKAKNTDVMGRARDLIVLAGSEMIAQEFELLVLKVALRAYEGLGEDEALGCLLRTSKPAEQSKELFLEGSDCNSSAQSPVDRESVKRFSDLKREKNEPPVLPAVAWNYVNCRVMVLPQRRTSRRQGEAMVLERERRLMGLEDVRNDQIKSL